MDPKVGILKGSASRVIPCRKNVDRVDERNSVLEGCVRAAVFHRLYEKKDVLIGCMRARSRGCVEVKCDGKEGLTYLYFGKIRPC